MKRNDMTAVRILCGVMLVAQVASAQSNRGPQPRAAKPAALEEASRILDRARSSGENDSAQRALESAAGSGRIESLAAQAAGRSASSTSAEDAVQKAADQKISTALSNVSTPEGKMLLAQNAASGPGRAPDASEVIPAAKVVPATVPDVSDAKPQALKPTPLAATKKEAARTIITSQGAAFFDSKQAMGVFTDDVVVNHPQFHLTSDELEVYMIKQAAPKEGEAPAEKSDKPPVREAGVLPGEKGPAQPDNNIRQAIAKGRKVVIQKLSENGEAQIGTCRHATYVGATGDIIMRDYPQVQRGPNVVIATDPSTVMTIKQNGELVTKGPNRVDIIQEADKKGGGGNNAAKPAAAAASNGIPAPSIKTTSRDSQ